MTKHDAALKYYAEPHDFEPVASSPVHVAQMLQKYSKEATLPCRCALQEHSHPREIPHHAT
jgi:hypothetical protein